MNVKDVWDIEIFLFTHDDDIFIAKIHRTHLFVQMTLGKFTFHRNVLQIVYYQHLSEILSFHVTDQGILDRSSGLVQTDSTSICNGSSVLTCGGIPTGLECGPIQLLLNRRFTSTVIRIDSSEQFHKCGSS